MRESRILIVGGGPSLSTAVVAALSGAGGVVIVAPGHGGRWEAADPVQHHLADDCFIAEPREVRLAPTRHGPQRRGSKGKVIRW